MASIELSLASNAIALQNTIENGALGAPGRSFGRPASDESFERPRQARSCRAGEVPHVLAVSQVRPPRSDPAFGERWELCRRPVQGPESGKARWFLMAANIPRAAQRLSRFTERRPCVA